MSPEGLGVYPIDPHVLSSERASARMAAMPALAIGIVVLLSFAGCGPTTIALLAYETWRRLPPEQRQQLHPRRASQRPAPGVLARAALAPALLASVDPERFANDPVLLVVMEGRVALARARAPGAADVLDTLGLRRRLRGGLLEPMPDRPPRAHVLWLFLRPDDLANLRIAGDERRDRSSGNGYSCSSRATATPGVVGSQLVAWMS